MGFYSKTLARDWVTNLRALPRWINANVDLGFTSNSIEIPTAPALSGSHTEPTSNKIPISWRYTPVTPTKSDFGLEKLISSISRSAFKCSDEIHALSLENGLGFNPTDKEFLWVRENSAEVETVTVQYSDNTYYAVKEVYSISELLAEPLPCFYKEGKLVVLSSLDHVIQTCTQDTGFNYVSSYYYKDYSSIWAEHPNNHEFFLLPFSNITGRFTGFKTSSALKYLIRNNNIETTLATVNIKINGVATTAEIKKVTNSMDNYKFMSLGNQVNNIADLFNYSNFRGYNTKKSLQFALAIADSANYASTTLTGFGIISLAGTKILPKWFPKNVYVEEETESTTSRDIRPGFVLNNNDLVNIEQGFINGVSKFKTSTNYLEEKYPVKSSPLVLQYYCQSILENSSQIQLYRDIVPEVDFTVYGIDNVNITIDEIIPIYNSWGKEITDNYLSMV